MTRIYLDCTYVIILCARTIQGVVRVSTISKDIVLILKIFCINEVNVIF